MKVAAYKKSASFDRNDMDADGMKPQCIICGKNVKGNAIEVELTDNGETVVLEGEDNGPRTMGWFDIGPDCYKRLMKVSTER